MRHLPLSVLPLLLPVGACSDSETGHDDTANTVHLAGLGDSIMQGFDAAPCGAPICFDQPEYSFAQGTDPAINSLLTRLGSPPSTFMSVSGAELLGGRNNVVAQARRLCDEPVTPTHIVILLGANDLCNASSLDDLPTSDALSTELEEALLLLTSSSCALPVGGRIQVLSIPRLDLLSSIGRAKTEVSCPEIWAEYDICPLVTQTEDPDLLLTVAARIAEWNTVLEATTNSVSERLADERDLTLTSDPTIGAYVFTPEDISSVDCFHPSVQGQSKLACLTWEGWLGQGALEGCLD